jgi:hypothetical protein
MTRDESLAPHLAGLNKLDLRNNPISRRVKQALLTKLRDRILL